MSKSRQFDTRQAITGHAGTNPINSKPICPKCGSRVVLFRQRDSTYGCRRCGARWDKGKSKTKD